MRYLILFLISFLCCQLTFSQNPNQFIGTWQLEKISYKKIAATNDGEQQFRDVFNTALYSKLNEKQRLDLYELEQLNEKAVELVKLYYQSEIEFQANQVFYNRSKMLAQPTSGEYLLDGKKLLMEWETADRYTYKILKLNNSQLVWMDVDLGVVYYYINIKTEKL
ncbi:MAG: hypothetical protein COA40_07810 [Aequorivita sp.]|nr:MAG: hypothetical protein COA40_07810 [Aequorivita sp.]